MEYQLSPNQWLQFPMEVRSKLKVIFSIPRSKGTILEGNVVKSDGHTFEDLAVITVGKMQEYLATEEEDFMRLLTTIVESIEAELASETPIIEAVDPEQLIVDEWVATLNRIRGQAVEKSMEDHLERAVKRVFEIKPIIKPEANVKKRKAKTTK